MAYHKIYDSWAWTGGHADGENDPEAIARREAEERAAAEAAARAEAQAKEAAERAAKEAAEAAQQPPTPVETQKRPEEPAVVRPTEQNEAGQPQHAGHGLSGAAGAGGPHRREADGTHGGGDRRESRFHDWPLFVGRISARAAGQNRRGPFI